METSLVGFGITLLYTGAVGSALYVALTLHQHSPLELRQYARLGMISVMIFVAVSLFLYSRDYATNTNANGPIIKLIYVCMLPLLTFFFWTCLMLEQSNLRFMPDRVQRVVLTFMIGMGVVWSPVIGTEGVEELCTRIHQWQLADTIEGLHRYQEDSARFPLGIQALIPYYIEQPPGLLCFGGDTNRYHLRTCDTLTVLVLQKISPSAQSVYILNGNRTGWGHDFDVWLDCN
jgi:hypothetical protein